MEKSKLPKMVPFHEYERKTNTHTHTSVTDSISKETNNLFYD